MEDYPKKLIFLKVTIFVNWIVGKCFSREVWIIHGFRAAESIFRNH